MKIEFSNDEREQIARRIQRYFNDELDQTLGQFDTEFLLDFFSEELGSFYYNRGLFDAQAIVQERAEHIADAIYELEKPTSFAK